MSGTKCFLGRVPVRGSRIRPAAPAAPALSRDTFAPRATMAFANDSWTMAAIGWWGGEP
jgi:hypothetical protein